MKGTRVAHYRIGPRLGSGGMGDVYRAEDTRLGRDVAIKFLPEELAVDRPALVRFHREARTASSLNHPNICTIHDTGEEEGRPYIVMELLEGTPLSHHLQGSPLPADQLLGVARDLAEGLKAAHEAGLVHRDIKPSNLFLTRHGHAKILDFGLAKTFESEDEVTEADTALTRKHSFLGTVAYASPEQVSGDPVDQRSDLFSLGIVLFELATGHHPFKRKSRSETAKALLNSDIDPVSRHNSNLPDSLGRIIEKLLHRDLDQRYQTASDLLDDLEQVEIARPMNRSSRILIGVATALLVLFALFVFWPSSPSQRIAVLPFDYEGPAELSHLANISVPTALADALRSVEGLDVAPFVASRRVSSRNDLQLAAQELEAKWVVRGQVQVEARPEEQYYVAQLRLFDTSQSRQVWTQEFQGDSQEYWQEVPYMASRLTDFLGIEESHMGHDSREREAMRFYLEGKRYLQGWDVDENALRAEKAFRQAIAINSMLAEARAGLALALSERWRDERHADLLTEALEEANQAVLLEPTLAEAYLAQATVYLQIDVPEKAEAAALRALELAPQDHTVIRKVAQAFAGLGKQKEAKEMFAKSIEMEPDDWETYNALGKFHYRRGEYEEAKEPFQKVIDLRRDSYLGYSNLAVMHMYLGEFMNAKNLLLAALTIQPNESVHNNLGLAHYLLGDFPKAAQQFEAAVQQSPEEAELWQGLGDAYRHMNEKEKSFEAYRQAIEKARAQLKASPENPEGRTILAASLAGLGRCAEARQEIERIKIDNPFVHYQCAVALSLCGETEAAQTHATAAIQGSRHLAAYIEASPDLGRLK